MNRHHTLLFAAALVLSTSMTTKTNPWECDSLWNILESGDQPLSRALTCFNQKLPHLSRLEVMRLCDYQPHGTPAANINVNGLMQTFSDRLHQLSHKLHQNDRVEQAETMKEFHPYARPQHGLIQGGFSSSPSYTTEQAERLKRQAIDCVYSVLQNPTYQPAPAPRPTRQQINGYQTP